LRYEKEVNQLLWKRFQSFEMLTRLLLISLFNGIVYSSCPGCPMDGDFENEPLKDDLKGLALSTMQQKFVTSNGEKNDKCTLELVSIDNFKTQIVAGTIYIFDTRTKWNSHCGELSNSEIICRNFRVFKELPVYCKNSDNVCLEIIRSEEIKCDRDVLTKNSHKFLINTSSRNICAFAVKSFMMVAIALL